MGTLTETKLTTFLSSVVFKMLQQLVLSTAGRHMLVAKMLRATLRNPAVSVWIMVGLTNLGDDFLSVSLE